MEQHTTDTRSPRLAFIVAMFLFAGLACNGTNRPAADIVFTVQRLDTQVFSGASSGSLSPLGSSSPQSLPKGHWVSTDGAGQALLQGQWSTNRTCRIYVFHSSSLVTKACTKSSYQGSNTATCQEENTAAYKECKGNVMMTPSGEVQVVGSWLTLTYLPSRQLTLVIVAEGVAEVYPVTRLEDGTLGDPIRVEAQHFLYTAPDTMLHDIAALPPREPLPIAELPPLVDELGIEPWTVQIIERAARDNVPLQMGQGQPTTTPSITPSPAPVVPSPTLVTPLPVPTTPIPTLITPSPVPVTPSPTFLPPSPTPISPSPAPVAPSPSPTTPSPPPITPTSGARDMHFLAQVSGPPSPPEDQGGVAWAIWGPDIIKHFIPRPTVCGGEPYPDDPDVIYWGTSQQNAETDLKYGHTIEVYGQCFLDVGRPAVRIPPEAPYFLQKY